uniref:tetraspanin-14-like isoform X1 n=1 Tax=Gasterosteus aculeatus aculeatus TaxID=481459 RepID=UPI001A98261E|nr:tetraspanin-14-like isoform X1 [Gasterosteus aculeatus aculeatus]XP_040034438.1 tetraspanin-14-like isoform X1 [Gasterosteus aculeatus aculeatus]
MRPNMYYYRYESAEVSCCYKYLMFSYNIIFWLAGVAFIAVGFWAWSEKGVLLDLTQVTQLHGFDPVWLVLVVGGVTFILGFAGCVGALRENICLLKFVFSIYVFFSTFQLFSFCSSQFSGVIGFIFLLELTAAVLAVVFQSQVREWINDFFLANVKGYRDDIDLQNLIDSLQRMNHCCGAQGPNDWNQNVYFSCNGTHRSREKCGVPFSCCITDPADSVLNSQCGYDVRNRPTSEWTEHIYTKGCIAALEDWLPGNLYTVAIVFIVISLLQMVGIYLARTLISDIEKVNFSY